MSTQNPEIQSPELPHPDEALQPTAPDFVETMDVPPLSAEKEPVPVWLYLACGVALFLTGSSFTGFQIFGRDMLDQGAGGPLASTTATVAAPPTPAELGKSLYNGNCANCHQASGEGQPGAYPPLGGSEWVLGSKQRLTAIMLGGIAGPLNVKGATYGTQVMPGWASVFTDEKLADIMTYLRSSWGNTAGPIASDEVAMARTKFTPHLTTPWCEADLLGIAPHGPDPTDKK